MRDSLRYWQKCWQLSALFALVTLALPSHANDSKGDPRDPWEGLNRSIFAFNEAADRYVATPIARGYKTVTPGFVDTSIDNFFNNIGEFKNFTNNLLQGSLGDAGTDLSRFVVNTTVGVLGIFDVASYVGLERENEDFGQTLAVWGVGDGPYLMLPVLGASTLRDGVGRGVDSLSSPQRAVEPESADYGLTFLELVQNRAALLGAEDLISGDKYSFLKDAYFQRREFLINDGEFQDSFGDEDFESFDF